MYMYVYMYVYLYILLEHRHLPQNAGYRQKACHLFMCPPHGRVGELLTLLFLALLAWGVLWAIDTPTTLPVVASPAIVTVSHQLSPVAVRPSLTGKPGETTADDSADNDPLASNHVASSSSSKSDEPEYNIINLSNVHNQVRLSTPGSPGFALFILIAGGYTAGLVLQLFYLPPLIGKYQINIKFQSSVILYSISCRINSLILI